MTLTTWILVGIGGVIVLWIIYAFNRLVTLRTRIEEAFSDIEVQLKRRYDLIPNLVETVKGYMGHERAVFENVTAARSAAMGVSDPHVKAEKENVLTGALRTLFAVAENYPDLKANTNFLELQREISDTENKIQSARRFYNGNVRDLNVAVQSFPSMIIAGMFGFKEREFFDLEDNSPAQEAVQVRF